MNEWNSLTRMFQELLKCSRNIPTRWKRSHSYRFVAHLNPVRCSNVMRFSDNNKRTVTDAHDIVSHWTRKVTFKFGALSWNMLIHCYLTVILRYGITRFCYFLHLFELKCRLLSRFPWCILSFTATCIGTIKLMIQQSIVYVRICTLPTPRWNRKMSGRKKQI